MRRRTFVRSAAPIAAAIGAQARGSVPPFASERISVTTRGSGPDVILIPGLGSDRSVWDGLAAQLEGRFRLHLVRINGFAGEPAGANAQGERVIAPFVEDLADYIGAERLDRPAVIGHSLGGTAALMLGARHPGLPGRLMVVDMVPFLAVVVAGPTATPEGVRPQADDLAAQMIKASPDAFARQERAMIDSYTQTEAARPALFKAAIDSDRVVMAHALRELMITDLGPELARIGVPTTVVYAWNAAMPEAAEADATYRKAYAQLDGVDLVRIDDSRHFVMIDQPQRFGAAVEEFLAGR